MTISVDFSVEVNRSVAVLDGAVLVVDAVAGVQAQTETVWRAMTQPSINNHNTPPSEEEGAKNGHEPLPCLALINKMDKDGCNFGNAIMSLRHKLAGANPIVIHLPLFRSTVLNQTSSSSSNLMKDPTIVADPTIAGEFVGVVDLVHMRAVIWPNEPSTTPEQCIPDIFPLLNKSHEPIDPACQVTKEALAARADVIASLADVDESIEEYFLEEREPSNAELRAALRRATLERLALPVMAGSAVKGRGIEPLLDAVADLLPSPLDRMPPALTRYDVDDPKISKSKKDREPAKNAEQGVVSAKRRVPFGHPLHPSVLALAFKVVHMKGRGGSGDGRVVFARVYSGQICSKDTLQVLSSPAPGEAPEKPRTERVGGMLELAGGQFNNLDDGICKSGDVCALVGLKSVVTGDTILLNSDKSGDKRSRKKGAKGLHGKNVCLSGVASPKPVLKVRLEAETSEEQKRLVQALSLLVIEDPSLVVEETESTTLLSGLGELHIEVALDRLYREFGLRVTTGAPSVAYRETVTDIVETEGLLEYDRTIGSNRMQASVYLMLEPLGCGGGESTDSPCLLLSDPVVTVGSKAREFMKVNQSALEEDLIYQSDVFNGLVFGCQGALRRGPIGSFPTSNLRCHVVDVDAEGGIGALTAMPGALRAAAANAVSETLHSNSHNCTVLEPTMSVEVSLSADMVGGVLSDLNGRRAIVGDVLVGDDEGQQTEHSKALVRADVPLSEILGYANTLRSLTAGEGAFSAEYKGHSPCDASSIR